MSRYEDALDEFERAREQERNWLPSHGPLQEVMDRRDAAQRELHAALDPWQPCLCPLCSGRGTV